MIISRRTMRDRLLRSRTHFQRLGAIARFRDRFFFPKCLMPEIDTIFPSAGSKCGSGSTSRSIATALYFKPRWLQSSLEILPILSFFKLSTRSCNHFLKFLKFFPHWNYQPVLYSHWREQSCKTIDRVCFSCYNVCQWILKEEYSSWFNLGAKEFSSFVWCFGSFIDFLCAHAADTEGRDADSLVWLWQASHRF